MYAHFLLIMGHGEEGLIHSERAVVLDPFNPLIHSFHAFVLYSRRRYEEAIAAAREAQRFQPDHYVASYALWIAYEKKGMKKEALEAAKLFARVAYGDPRMEAALDEGYAQGGYAEAMNRAAEFLVARLPKTYCLPGDIAMYLLWPGRRTRPSSGSRGVWRSMIRGCPTSGCPITTPYAPTRGFRTSCAG